VIGRCTLASAGMTLAFSELDWNIKAGPDVPRASRLSTTFRRGSSLSSLTNACAPIVILALNVYKRRGMTRYGWRKQQEQQRNR